MAHATDGAREILKGMMLNKLKYSLTLVLMLAVLGGGAGWVALPQATTPEAPQAPAEPSKAASTPKPEWQDEEPLPDGAVGRLGTLHFRHAESITRIAIGTDGTRILSAAGKAVYIWDLATGKERRRFAKHETPVTSFACSHDGKLLASGCQDGTIHVWDTATGRERLHFAAYKIKTPDDASSLGLFVAGFTPDGRQIVSADSDNTIRLWDVASGEIIREYGRFSAATRVSLSSDGKTIASVVKNDMTWELRLWEVATGRERKRRPQPGKRFLSPAFSPDGKMLAVSIGEEDWQKPCDIQLWDVEAAKEIRTLQGHKGWAWCAFSPDGKILASSSTDNTARLWDANTGKEIGRIGADKPAHFNQLLFCLDGRTLVSCTYVYHTFRFWDRVSGKEVRSSGDAISPIDFINFSPDGRLLAAGSKEHWDIRLWDVATRKTIRRLEHDLFSAVQFSPDGSRLASAACADSQVRLWQVANGKELRRIPSEKSVNTINRMAWSGDGKVLATWSRKDRLLRLWNLDTGKQLREWSVGIRVESLVFSPDSKILAAFGSDEPVRSTFAHILLWAMDTGRPLPSLKVTMEPPYLSSDDQARIAFSPDGRTLAAGARNAEASIYAWELASGRLRFTLTHGEDVACLAFSPDGKLLAAVNNINAYRNYLKGPESLGLKVPLPRIHLWDVVADKEIQVLKGHQGAICTLAFSPDGKLLATGSNDTTVLLWDATRFRTNRPTEIRLSSERLEALWGDLGGADAVKAYRAIRTLAAAPKASAAFLQRHLRPVAAADANEVARLLADLDSEQFDVREKAMQELEKLGDSAATALHKALVGKPTLEVRRRIEQLLEKEKGVEHIRMGRALESLERMGTAEARDWCAKLADGVPDAPLTQEARATLRRMTR